ncbi:E3 ubiquitin-protein ligase AIRP2-like [Malania oleifera]|uniref:E3 ubiquitin-protein ligase AIRP2-like n=1 Tax=Malania oleifera TaxID=397392 RepID=UPI0025AE87CE|nr:E3 ubiquitin-protein ligase AIRP2-like [Malania oleifera]
MEMMMYYGGAKSSYQDSLKVLEADILHANALAAAIPSSKGGARLQMKLVYNHMAPLFLFLLQWLDCSCTCLHPRYLNLFHILVYQVYTDGRPNISTHVRKATIRDFYAVILPSLRRLHGDLMELDDAKDGNHDMMILSKKRVGRDSGTPNVDLEREDECGICLEPCAKVVLPNCCHAMCINCYRDWNTRSESCPFCRGTLKRVNSEDLWVLTCNNEVVDAETVSKEDLLHFYIYINSLPKDSPDALFLVYYEYLI